MARNSTSNNPATKKDLRKLEKALRIDLATKQDLKKFALKTDLRKVEKSLRHEILKVEERVENIEEKVDKVDKKLDRIEIKLDGFVGNVETLREENAAGVIQYRRHEERLKNHEERITTLEST